MAPNNIISDLEKFRKRLSEVNIQIHSDYGFGVERWESFLNALSSYFDENLKAYSTRINEIANKKGGVINLNEPLYERFRKRKVIPMDAFLRSLILDIKDGDILQNSPLSESKSENVEVPKTLIKRAFIVHGHDVATQQKTARFLEQIGFEAIILSEKPSKGMTIIEKLEHYIDAEGFGVVLYTPDDEGSVKDKKDYKPRARQNVVFEHGWLIGALGRNKVIQVVTDHTIELPNDISGVVYLSDKGWELDFMNEIHAMGYDVDYNLLRKS